MKYLVLVIFGVFTLNTLVGQCAQLQAIQRTMDQHIAFQDHLKLFSLLQNAVLPLDRNNLDEDCKRRYSR